MSKSIPETEKCINIDKRQLYLKDCYTQIAEKGNRMFFKNNSSIEFTSKIMRKNRIPILIHHKQWRELFSDNMNRYMENLSRELEKLIKEEKESRKRLEDYRHRKRILMNKIIHLSNRLNIKGESVDVTEIENSKNEILGLNEKIDRIYENLEEYAQNIEDANMELLEETAKISYSEIDKSETRMGIVNHEIDLLRGKLGEYWDEKEALEAKVQALYSLLHSIIGSEEIEKLDEKFLKK